MLVDHYQILQVSPDASSQAILKAYRRLAQKTHPDRNPHGADKFVQVRQAFDVLNDPAARAQFDELRRQYLNSRATSSGMVATAPTPSMEGWWSDLRDRWRQPATLPQADKASTFIRVPLSQIITGTTRQINLRVARSCPACEGQRKSCRVCGGTGQRFILRSWNVHVPPGTVDGANLRLPGQGHHGPRFGAPGDVLVQVVWSRRHNWKWEGGQLVSRLKIDNKVLREGGRTRLRSPEGRWGYIDVPAGPVSTRRIKVPGLGLPNAAGVRGPAWVDCSPRSAV